MSHASYADFIVGDPKRDQDILRVMESVGQAAEDCLYKTLYGAGVIQAGMSRRAILEAARTFLKDAAMIPEIHLQPDMVDDTVLHVSVSFRAVKIEPKPVVCEQCGGSKIDIGLDDMGAPLEGPCRKCS